tara:strand:- start:5288 stop:5608 length:321 start_codon:yes stop_codon:yes gene_type:complete
MGAALKIEEIILPEENELKRGHEVLFLQDYQVWGHNVKGKSGIIIKEKTSFGKCIVYVSDIGEYCEPSLDILKVFTDVIPEANKEFISRIKELEYTLPTNRNIQDD